MAAYSLFFFRLCVLHPFRQMRPILGRIDHPCRTQAIDTKGHAVRYLKADAGAAVDWFRRAADQGDNVAQFALGALYTQGLGVPKDYVEAYFLFHLAAVHSPPGRTRDKAAQYMEIVGNHLTHQEINEAKRLVRKWRPKLETEPEQ